MIKQTEREGGRAVMFLRWATGLLLSSLAAEAFAASITVSPLGSGDAILFVEGELLSSDVEEFRSKISPYSDGVVALSSKGGNVLAGIQIGNTIRLRNFTTLVPAGETCASACALAWLGGTRRLMGKPALIGFHAAFRASDRSESGIANAVVGKYLADLGLSYGAIAYVTSSAPSSMTWMTPEDAEKVGIDVAIFDPKQVPSSNGPAEPSQPVASQLQKRSGEFLNQLYSTISGSNERALAVLNGMYADSVSYFGKNLSHAEVMNNMAHFVERWPQRDYKPRGQSVEIVCNPDALTCKLKGTLDFDARSSPRNQRSRGAASFEFVLAFPRPGGSPKITLENGAPLDRQLGPLQVAPPMHGKD